MKLKPETAIFEIFEAVSNVSRPKQKVELLNKAFNIDKDIFVYIVRLVYSNKIKFYVNEKTIAKLQSGDKYKTDFKEFVNLVTMLDKRKVSGKKQFQVLQDFWSKLDEFHAKWYGRILMKDLRIGVGEALLSQVLSQNIKETVPSPMLAVPLSDLSDNVIKKLLQENDLFIEVKIDGFRLISCIYDTHVECYTRNGKRVPYLEQIFYEDFVRLIKSDIQKPFILDGEVFSKDWNLTMSFSPNRKIKLTPDQEKSLRYYIFDLVRGDIHKYKRNDVVKERLLTRKKRLSDIFSKTAFVHFIQVIPYYIDSKISVEEKIRTVDQYTENFIKDGWEGSVVKLVNSYYEWARRSKAWLKVKKFNTLDLLVVDVEPSTKRPHEIAALVVLYKGNKVRVSGLTDKERKRWYRNPSDIIGKIIEVKHMGETKHGKLRHPTFIRVRFDKDKPDA